MVMEKGTAAIGLPNRLTVIGLYWFRGMYSTARMLRAVETKYVWEKGKVDMPCNPSYQFHQGFHA